MTPIIGALSNGDRALYRARSERQTQIQNRMEKKKMELARKIFHSLERGYYPKEYLVLNDRNFVARFRAETDADAIQIFETGAYK